MGGYAGIARAGPGRPRSAPTSDRTAAADWRSFYQASDRVRPPRSSLQAIAEVLNRPFEPRSQRHLGIEFNQLFGALDIGTPLFGVVRRQRAELDLGVRARELPHHLRQFQHRELTRVAQVHRAVELAQTGDSDQALDEVVDVAEGA